MCRNIRCKNFFCIYGLGNKTSTIVHVTLREGYMGLINVKRSKVVEKNVARNAKSREIIHSKNIEDPIY